MAKLDNYALTIGSVAEKLMKYSFMSGSAALGEKTNFQVCELKPSSAP